MNYEDKKMAYERRLAKYGTIMRMIIPEEELEGTLHDDPASMEKLIDRLAGVDLIVRELRVLFDIDAQVSLRRLDKLLQKIGVGGQVKSGWRRESKNVNLGVKPYRPLHKS